MNKPIVDRLKELGIEWEKRDEIIEIIKSREDERNITKRGVLKVDLIGSYEEIKTIVNKLYFYEEDKNRKKDLENIYWLIEFLIGIEKNKK